MSNKNLLDKRLPKENRVKIDTASTKRVRHVEYIDANRDTASHVLSSDGFSGVFGVFKIVFLLILLVNVVSIMSGSGATFTFTAFLHALQDAPTVEMTFNKIITLPTWLGNLPFFGSLFQFSADLISVAVWGAKGVYQVALYVIWLFGFLF